MYADYTYYQQSYRGEAVPEQEWPRMAVQADAFIDAITFGRLHHGWMVTDNVKMACCAVAEEIFSQQQEKSAKASAAGIRSENTDGYSASYADYSIIQQANRNRRLEAAEVFLPASDPIRYAGLYGRRCRW